MKLIFILAMKYSGLPFITSTIILIIVVIGSIILLQSRLYELIFTFTSTYSFSPDLEIANAYYDYKGFIYLYVFNHGKEYEIIDRAYIIGYSFFRVLDIDGGAVVIPPGHAAVVKLIIKDSIPPGYYTVKIVSKRGSIAIVKILVYKPKSGLTHKLSYRYLA